MKELFFYGQHFPNALQAISWVTSSNFGTFRQINKIEYLWNYYDYPTPLPANHPYDKSALINYANGTQFTTCRDANAHLLYDFNRDGELDVAGSTAGGFGYMEHSGRGVNNELKGNPFSNFWFDDNSLAKYMNIAYDYPVPDGLHEYDDFTRWRIVGGNSTNWSLYSNPKQYPDQLALNGLYYLAIHKETEAYSMWKQILTDSKASYNSDLQRYDYSGIHESYHFGLWLILTSMLRTIYPTDNLLLQHYISIRSNVLSIQVKDDSLTTLETGPFYGWTSDASGGNSLMNTESVSTNVLGLGANALFTYELGRSPLQSDAMKCNYFLRPHNVLSAVEGLSQPGYLSYGPYITLATSSSDYTLEVYYRSGTITSTSLNGNDSILNVDIYDSSNTEILQTKPILRQEFSTSNEWRIASIPFSLKKPNNKLEFRIWWFGMENVDSSIVRILN